jgi:hypothetical protein
MHIKKSNPSKELLSTNKQFLQTIFHFSKQKYG